jgi:hypothetical protein
MLPALIPVASYLAKGWERLLSILVWVILIGAILFACWATFIKPTFHPTPTTTQTGGISNTYQIHVGLGGCARIPVMAEKK